MAGWMWVALPAGLLSKVWELADADKDHRLSPNEFAVAMHLIVCATYVPAPSLLLGQSAELLLELLFGFFVSPLAVDGHTCARLTPLFSSHSLCSKRNLPVPQKLPPSLAAVVGAAPVGPPA